MSHISFPRHEYVVAPKPCVWDADGVHSLLHSYIFPCLPAISWSQGSHLVNTPEILRFWNLSPTVGNFVGSQVEELRKVREGPLFQTKGELSKLKPRVVKAGVLWIKLTLWSCDVFFWFLVFGINHQVGDIWSIIDTEFWCSNTLQL